jgi:soluble lytic murein transglycosylase-like protein
VVRVNPAQVERIRLLAIAEKASAQYGLPAGLLEGLIHVESGWDPQAVGRNTNGSVDRGIVQINNRAHPEVSDQQAYDPAQAIPWAAAYLRQLYQSCGSWTGALAAYNSGRCSGDPGYVGAVLSAARQYGYGSPSARVVASASSPPGAVPPVHPAGRSVVLLLLVLGGVLWIASS